MAQATPSISIRYTTYGAGFNAATYEPKTRSAGKYEDVVADCHNFRAAPVSRALADIWDKAIAQGQKTLGEMIMEKIEELNIQWDVVTGFQMIDTGAQGRPGDEVVYVAVRRTETVEADTEIKRLRSALYPAILEILARAGATKDLSDAEDIFFTFPKPSEHSPLVKNNPSQPAAYLAQEHGQ